MGLNRARWLRAPGTLLAMRLWLSVLGGVAFGVLFTASVWADGDLTPLGAAATFVFMAVGFGGSSYVLSPWTVRSLTRRDP